MLQQISSKSIFPQACTFSHNPEFGSEAETKAFMPLVWLGFEITDLLIDKYGKLIALFRDILNSTISK